MAAVTGWRVALLALSAVTATPAGAADIERWRGEIAEASTRFGIPQQWIRRVMSAESNGSPTWRGKPITSRAGAMGLMQLMPGTWDEMRRQYALGTDPYDPRDNILAGAAYLRSMYRRFGYPGLFAAYNAGPHRYRAFLERGTPLPDETVSYVATVTRQSVSVAAAAQSLAKAASPAAGSLSLESAASVARIFAIAPIADAAAAERR